MVFTELRQQYPRTNFTSLSDIDALTFSLRKEQEQFDQNSQEFKSIQSKLIAIAVQGDFLTSPVLGALQSFGRAQEILAQDSEQWLAPC